MTAINLPVLLYHQVGPRRPGTNPELTLSPERFEAQIRFLGRRGYRAIGPSQWVDWCHRGQPLPAKPLLITFDDGYADIAQFALPILRRFDFAATVYVVTGQIGGTNLWDQRQWGSAVHRLMSAEQIRYWAGQGIGFGAHTRSHPDLTLQSSEELKEEIDGSAADLASIVGSRPVSFAYPYGIYDTRVRDCVQLSFEVALTCDEGLNSLATDLHRLRRAEILPSDNMWDFACRLNLGWLPVAHLRRAVRRRAGSAIRRLRAAARFQPP
jgi:peptidoglycan/xylan/chitin deacetylase (PgdA/CDA1 family)